MLGHVQNTNTRQYMYSLSKKTIQFPNLSNPNRTFLRMYSNIPVTIEKINLF